MNSAARMWLLALQVAAVAWLAQQFEQPLRGQLRHGALPAAQALVRLETHSLSPLISLVRLAAAQNSTASLQTTRACQS